MRTLIQDIHYGVRLLLKSRGFTAVAVLTLALGIGANTAIFSIVNSVLLHPLPFHDPDQMMRLVFSNQGVGARDIGLSVPEFDDLRTRAEIFQDVSVVWPANANLTGAQHPERLEILGVSPNYFSMLGVTAQVGRVFGPQDNAEGFAEAVVISDSLWRRSFGGDEHVLGRKLQLDNDPYTIVGVLPRSFRHPGRTVSSDVDVWATAGFRANPFPRPTRSIRFLPGAIARVKPGISLGQVQSKLTAFSAALRNDYPNDYQQQSQWMVEAEPLQQSLVGDVRPMLWLLMGSVVLIILIASVNIANLLLARASGRQREVAVRLALGARRSRIVMQMLVEAMVLAFISGIAGILTAAVALNSILHYIPAKVPRLSEVHIDWTVLVFALSITLLTGLLFGLAPAIQAVNGDLFAAIREGARGSGYSVRTSRMRGLLIGSELALAVVLMVGAGLLLRTFWGLLQENPGFNPNRVVTAGLWLPQPNNPAADPYAKPEAEASFVREVLRRVSGLPGVEMTAMTTDLPVTSTAFRIMFTIEGRPAGSSPDLAAEISGVNPDYFKVIQAALAQGRFFAETDDNNKQPVAIVDETTARHFWPDQDALGKRVKFGPGPGPAANPPWLNVVGVIKDIKHYGLDSDRVPHIYVSIYQFPAKNMNVVMRTSLPASTLEPQVRREIQAVDPNLPVFDVKSMDDVIGVSLAARRFSAELVGAFAVLALLLASLGIYGLLAYMVGQRSHEIGVRMALGAQPENIRKMVLAHGALLAGIGIIVGVVFAGIAAPMLSTLLYGVHPMDPLVFVTVPALLMLVALLASYIPAHSATKVDPIVALRDI
jgi:putative ABC transport system permease protein